MTDKVKWPVGGYAPGGYAGAMCTTCREHFIAAKRAYTCADCTIQSLLAERDALEAENQRLREALSPFAEGADELDFEAKVTGREHPDGEWAKFRILAGDFRKARTALAQKEGE